MTAVLLPDDVAIDPGHVHAVLARSILADGLDFVLDLDRSAGSHLVDARTGERYLDMFTFFASSALGMNHPALADDEDVPGRARAGRGEQAEQLRRVQRADGAFRRHLRSRPRRSRAAAPVLRRRRRAGGRERAEGGVRLEEPAQRGARHRSRPGHQGAAPARRLPRPQRLHAVADQHRPQQGRPVPEVRLAAHRRAVHPARLPTMDALEAESLRQARAAFEANPHDIACFIAEPIQGEGGDRHFRPQFFAAMRDAVRRVRRAADLRRGADRLRADRNRLGLPAIGCRARRGGIRQEDPGVRRDGRAPGRRGRRQRVPRSARGSTPPGAATWWTWCARGASSRSSRPTG